MRARIVTAAALVLALAGCGGTGQKEREAAGAKVFASAGCATCHTLAAAKSHGQIGPNLDALKPAYGAVVRQVTRGGNGMPSFAGQLRKNQIRAVAAYVADATKNSAAASVLVFKPDATKLSSCRGDYGCDKQAFGNVAYHQGPEKALAELDAVGRTDPAIRSGCHQITHEIGHAAYLRYHGNAAVALSHGAMTCWSGYYHGVIERAFGGVPKAKVATTARRLCSGAAVRKTLFMAYQCVHGLGHGLMIYSADDLPYALHVCDQLETAWDQSSCTGGVFMQNFLPGPMAMVKTKWMKKSDLIYPCNVVAKRDKLYCYLMVTSRILPDVNYSWEKTAAWCRRAERAWIATCFQSFGRDASGNSVQNGSKIVRICRVAGSMERECIYGASRDLTSNDAGGRRAAAMCLLAPASTRAYCFNGIGTILGGFVADSAGRHARCDAVTPPRYRADCYRGAGA